MALPTTYTDQNDTGCCAVPNIAEWDQQEYVFNDRLFVRMHTRSFLFVPLNMTKIMAALQQVAAHAGAELPPQQVMILSRDISPWKAEQLYGVSKPIPNADMVILNGTYITKVFEGPYKDARKWAQAMHSFAASRSQQITDLYFDYTTCPKCAKRSGKNYVYGIAKVATS